MTPDVEAAITQAAQEAGEDPAWALAVADRESNGNPNATASKSIYGLFQMTGKLRAQYGAGDSSDPYTQAKAWTAFIGDTKNDLAQRLGRPPTNAEAYLAHYFGPGRAAGMIAGSTAPNTDVRDVFTPTELAENPEISKAGTVGPLVNSIAGDITQRAAKFGSAPSGGSGADFASFGTAPGDVDLKSNNPVDFASFGGAAATSPNSGALAGDATTDPSAALTDVRLGQLDSQYGSATPQAAGVNSSLNGPLQLTAAMAPNGFDYSDWRRSTNVEDDRNVPLAQTLYDNFKRNAGRIWSTVTGQDADSSAPTDGARPGTEVDLSQLGAGT